MKNLTFQFCIIKCLHTFPEENPLQVEIGIIGGSGLYSMPGLTDVREVSLETPFGAPSDAYVLGTLSGRKVAFLFPATAVAIA